ncbi:MAG: sigma-54-dependent Fis family transcriptional regulator [Deltaproteobacteria bacterium]|nr:sigma-54-dependent Fis family transcriptional regulator [Deltaproteobacteria bacterium]
MSGRILIAEDEEILRVNLCEFLEKAGYEVEGVADGAAAYAKALEHNYEVLVADIRMPGLDGISLLKRVVAERPETLVLISTAYASVESAVEALRHGAYDYLLKPIVFEDLLQKLHNLFVYRALQEEVVRLRQSVQERLGFEGIVGDTPQVRRVFELIDKVAPTPSTVLITGESGTGKELVARAIHQRSQVKDREFLAVNVAAIPNDLIESYLFGHERGAFTSAVRERDGILRTARGGTVFLDEVGELTSQVQAKLLRALEAHEIQPVGGDRPIRVDFRLIAATNQPLEDLVAKGTFRRDLFFRLNVFRIDVPPLKERRQDIPALANHFLSLHCRTIGKRVAGLKNDTMRLLLAYAWPGNVRELSNVIERAVLLADGELVTPQDVPAEIRDAPAGPMALKAAIEEFERQHISRVLAEVDGDKEQAAKLLGIHVATLYRHLEKSGQ